MSNVLHEDLQDTQATKELKELLEKAKSEPKQPDPAPKMVDHRTPSQRHADFMHDLQILVERDRIIAVPTCRHLPNGDQWTVEFLPVVDQK